MRIGEDVDWRGVSLVFGACASFFLIFLLGVRGFFADEFQYINLSYLGVEGLRYLLQTPRLPLVPVILKVLSPLGLSFGNDLGLFAFKVLVWVFGLAGAFLLGRELGGKRLESKFVLVLGFFYVWVFYAAKVLTDALLVGMCLWFVLCCLKLFDKKENPGFWLSLLLIVSIAGLLTKMTFLAVFPLAVLALRMPRRASLFVFGLGFGAAVSVAGLYFGISGYDRYWLPCFVFLALGACAFFQSLGNRAGWSFVGVWLWVNLICFAVVFPLDAALFAEAEAVSDLGVSGVVVANLGDYAKWYCPGCSVVNWLGANLSGADWVVLQYKDLYFYDEIRALKLEVGADARFCGRFDEDGLTVWQRCS